MEERMKGEEDRMTVETGSDSDSDSDSKPTRERQSGLTQLMLDEALIALLAGKMVVMICGNFAQVDTLERRLQRMAAEHMIAPKSTRDGTWGGRLIRGYTVQAWERGKGMMGMRLSYPDEVMIFVDHWVTEEFGFTLEDALKHPSIECHTDGGIHSAE